MLIGRYDYSIDAKGRLNFPPRFRAELGETFIVTRWLDDCLVAFSQSEFERVADSFAEKSMAQSRDIQRFLFSAAAEVQPDSHGRILLPAHLRKHAKIEKEVTVVGNRNHAEIWSTPLWEAHEGAIDQAAIQAAMEQIGM